MIATFSLPPENDIETRTTGSLDILTDPLEDCPAAF